jgi:transposase
MARPSNNYPAELRERSVAMFNEIRKDYPSDWKAAESIAEKLNVRTTQTVLNWVRKAQVDAGERAGMTSEEAAEMRKLRAENRELKRANEILKAGSVFFAAELCATRRQMYREVVRNRLCWAVAAA